VLLLSSLAAIVMIAGHNIRLDAVLDICFSPHYVQ